MKLETIQASIEEITKGLGIVWRSNIAKVPLEETGEAIERREITGQLVVSDFGFFIRIVCPDEDTEMEPEAWANVIRLQLESGIHDLSVHMNNAAVDIKNKSRELAAWR